MYRCCPSVRPVPPSKGKTKRPMNTKLGRKGPWDTSTLWTNYEVKGSKVKVTGHGSCVNVSLIIRPSNVGIAQARAERYSAIANDSPGGACEYGLLHTPVLNRKDGPISGGPSTAAPSC